MGLYERLIGKDESGFWGGPGQIPTHLFTALMGEFARGTITGADAQAAITLNTGLPLAPDEVAEANTLLATISGTAVQKLARAKKIEDVFLLATARKGVVGYEKPSEVKAKLGV